MLLHRIAWLLFTIAIGAMAYNAGWLLTTTNPYPHSAMAAGIMVAYITTAHSGSCLLLVLWLLALREWCRAGVVLGLLVAGRLPLALFYWCE